MNRITFTGRLAADAELRFAPSGNAVLNFRTASDVGFGDKKSTNWFACAIFGKRAESLAPHLKKGQEVTIFGSLNLREYTNRDGVKQISPDVAVDDIQMHGGKQHAAAQTPAAQHDDMDSVPF
jgi:single-strand DNA-binding protein